MQRDHRHRFRGAFTLIELLVVVSIVALLVAILLPALSGARLRSQSVLCLARLRTLADGWHMYADDFDDVAVPGRMANLGGGTGNPANWYDVGNGLKYRPRWIAAMGRYVGVYGFDMPRTDYDRQDYDSKAYQCPAVPDWVDERNGAFGYNHQFLGNGRQTAGQFHNFPVNRSSIASFGGTVLAADCMGTAAGLSADRRAAYGNDATGFDQLGNHGWTLDPPRLTALSDVGSGDPGSPRTAVDPRHLGKANAIFCDGHGQTEAPYSLGYRIRGDGSYADTDGGDLRPTNYWFSGTGRDDDPPPKPGTTPS
jgi:prepilin-type N-terminal cleavage/methylation domain-containing protein/prepilin-type processing-associated H-X9-DG protein